MRDEFEEKFKVSIETADETVEIVSIELDGV